MGAVGPPERLASRHDISQFSSGVPALDAWLQGKRPFSSREPLMQILRMSEIDGLLRT